MNTVPNLNHTARIAAFTLEKSARKTEYILKSTGSGEHFDIKIKIVSTPNSEIPKSVDNRLVFPLGHFGTKMSKIGQHFV